MSETYDEIIEEIDRCKYVCDFFGAERSNCEICSQHENCFRSSSKNIAARVRKAVGGDPTEWWVECSGERVHIGDYVSTPSTTDEVQGFKIRCGKKVVNLKTYGDYQPDILVKITDCREKIIEELTDQLFVDNCLTDECEARKIAEQFVNRAMKLTEVDA